MSTSIRELTASIDNAKKWVMDSGIQNKDTNALVHGSYNAWYDSDLGEYAYLYSESSGYFMTLMCHLFDLTGENKYLLNGKNAGDWMLNATYESNGAFRCLSLQAGPSKYDHKQDQMYAFDNGVIVNGLVNLYRSTKNEKYLAAAVTTADWLVMSAQSPSGSFMPVYDIDAERFFESDKEWSMSAGSYHVKIAIGLLNLYDLTDSKKYLEAVVKVCDHTLGYQLASGRYISFLSKGGTNAHPHCYTAEGLWVSGKYLDREDYSNSSANSIRWLLDLQNSEGMIPRLFLDDKPVYHERIDAMAQTARMAMIHIAEERLDPSYLDHVEKIISVVLDYQVKKGNRHELGGFCWGKSSKGVKMPHPNSWVTAFAVQALQLYSDFLENSKCKLHPFYLV